MSGFNSNNSRNSLKKVASICTLFSFMLILPLHSVSAQESPQQIMQTAKNPSVRTAKPVWPIKTETDSVANNANSDGKKPGSFGKRPRVATNKPGSFGKVPRIATNKPGSFGKGSMHRLITRRVVHQEHLIPLQKRALRDRVYRLVTIRVGRRRNMMDHAVNMVPTYLVMAPLYGQRTPAVSVEKSALTARSHTLMVRV